MDDKYQLALRDPVFKDATMEANRWYRDGLFDSTTFTDTSEQVLEKLTTGRVGVAWYEHSKDQSDNKFRKILMETFPGDSYEVISPFPFPPANGLSTDDIYGDIQTSIGWNVTCITTSAEQPQRIFDLLTYFLTPEAAVIQMYGPKGELWDKLDENGVPNFVQLIP